MNIDKIVQATKENGLTLHSLSLKSKVGYATIHDIISGKAKNPRIDTVSKIAAALKTSIDELLKKEDKDEKSSIENQKKEKSSNTLKK